MKFATKNFTVQEARTSGCGKFVKLVFKNPDNGDVVTRTTRVRNMKHIPAVGTLTPVRLAVGPEDTED